MPFGTGLSPPMPRNNELTSSQNLPISTGSELRKIEKNPHRGFASLGRHLSEKLIRGWGCRRPVKLRHLAIERVGDGFEPILVIPLAPVHQFRDDAFRRVEATRELLGSQAAMVEPFF